MYPLCERDYFARLDLICANCDQALRSSYITACGESIDLNATSADTQATNITSSTSHVQSVMCCSDQTILTMSTARKFVSCLIMDSGPPLMDRLSLSLLHAVCCQMRRMRNGHLEAIRRDEQKRKRRMLAPRMLHDLQGGLNPFRRSQAYV